MKRILFTGLSPGSHKNAKRWEWRYGEEEDGRWHGDEEEESRQAAIIRRNWHRCSRWDADLIYLSRLSGILILVRGRAFSNDASSAPSSSPLSLSLSSSLQRPARLRGPPEARRELLANWLYLVGVSRLLQPFFFRSPLLFLLAFTPRGRKSTRTI